MIPTPRGVLIQRDPQTGETWISAGCMSTEDAGKLGDILAVFARAKRGSIWRALLTFAAERLRRGSAPGATLLRLDEGGGDPEVRGADWGIRIETAERRRAG